MIKEYLRHLKLVKEPGLSAELSSMMGDEKRISAAFSGELSFGTGGLRAIMGAGVSRMNIYTVRRASLGLAEYTRAIGGAYAAVGYDTRRNSELFARVTAEALSERGVSVYLFAMPYPTPMLSYAVRELRCDVGVMITASHNPREYNGYKVYGSDGGQITDEAAKRIAEYISKEDYFETEKNDAEKGKISYIEDSLYDSYIETVSAICAPYEAGGEKDIKIAYTALNGTGARPVLRILEENGYKNVVRVEEQMLPDGDFPTCPYPNPELPEALTLGIKYAKKSEADILLATDPDSDRVGVAVRHGEEYRILTGNEVGVLLLDFLVSKRDEEGTMPPSAVAYKTVVTSRLCDRIAEAYGIELRSVLTGFKYIGEGLEGLRSEGREGDFLLGFEESCGYLSGPHVRDKDGVNAALLIAHLTAFHKAGGKTLVDALADIYEKYGYETTHLSSYVFDGEGAKERVGKLMSALRSGAVRAFGQYELTDYSLGVGRLPKSDVLVFSFDIAKDTGLENGASLTVTVRPSGTEPKVKLYLSALGEREPYTKWLIAQALEYFGKLIEHFEKL